jgi:hypothetical protein
VTLYGAYGLAIQCEEVLPLVELSKPRAPDAFIQFADSEAPLAPGGDHRRQFSRRSDGWTLRYDNRAGGWLEFDYESPRRILSVAGSAALEDAIKPLVGVVCALLLDERGSVPLHAATLKIGPRAVAILGPSGSGKSTLAAALIEQGAELFSEDLLAVTRYGAGFQALRGPQTLSLLEDAFAEFRMSGHGEAGSPHMIDHKRQLTLSTRATDMMAPLSAFYLLGSTAGSARLGATAATAALIQNLYGMEYLGPVTREHLDLCTCLAREIPVVPIRRAPTLAEVRDNARSIAEGLSVLDK